MRIKVCKSVAITAGVVMAIFSMINVLYAQNLTWISGLPDKPIVEARGVSSDGSVVVGHVRNASGAMLAFRWTAQTGTVSLGTLGGTQSEATDVSADGSVVVGWAFNQNGTRRPFRWTLANGMEDLGTLGGDAGEAWGISANGLVIVGWAQNSATEWRPFRRTAQGMFNLGTLGGSGGCATAVSADGSVIVGWARNSQSSSRAFRWTSGTGMQNIGAMLGGPQSGAQGVSPDGSRIVGWTLSGGYRNAFQWDAWNGLQEIGSYGGTNCTANAVASDGTIVGSSTNALGHWHAVRWNEEFWPHSLNQAYSGVVNNSALARAVAITPDARFIVGHGINSNSGQTEAYLLDTLIADTQGDVNGDGCVDDLDILAVLFAFGQTGENLPEDLNGDGIIDDADLLVVLFNFGRGC